ncbi:MAG: bifunctional folylpolyglutamate synthase/dihydrofolate synthase [Bacteroidetes bacterium]|nr:bifunctional folylpolyglutamate synthase/dihydrofolate synthase [Bacteroidota bacterium]
MNYSQTVQYLFTQLPMFQRVGAAAYKTDLDNTQALCRILKHPEQQFKSIHIAGTNGKGSTSHMLAAVFQQAGYKTGLYTSPHLKDFRERIKINGKEIPKKYVIQFVEKYKSQFEKIQLSFFEWTVGVAFQYFAEQKVDIAIIEVGLGGRLDSTNVINPLVSLITNISLDHTNLLGSTVQKIAKEKAGIIKNKVPIIIGQTQTEVQSVFIKKAKKSKSDICFADSLWRHQKEQYLPKTMQNKHYFLHQKKEFSYTTDLPGTCQKYNIAAVLSVLQALQNQFPISKKQIQEALKNTKKNTGLRGRWELLNNKPRTIADTGHNADGIKQVLLSVRREYQKKNVRGNLHVVFGAVNDKDLETVFSLLKKDTHFKKAHYYFCKLNIPRGMDVFLLQQEASKYGLKGSAYSSVKKALAAAQKQAKTHELVFVGGSTFTVAEAL